MGVLPRGVLRPFGYDPEAKEIAKLHTAILSLLSITPTTIKTDERVYKTALRELILNVQHIRDDFYRMSTSEQCDIVYRRIGIPDTCYICGTKFTYFSGSKTISKTGSSISYEVLRDKVDTPHCDHVLPTAPGALLIGTYDEFRNTNDAYMTTLRNYGYKYACRLCNLSKSDTCLLNWDIGKSKFCADVEKIRNLLEVIGTLQEIRENNLAVFLDQYRLRLHDRIRETYRGSTFEYKLAVWKAERAGILTAIYDGMGEYIMNRAATVKTLAGFIGINVSRLNNPRNFRTVTLNIIKQQLEKKIRSGIKLTGDKRNLYIATVAALEERPYSAEPAGTTVTITGADNEIHNAFKPTEVAAEDYGVYMERRRSAAERVYTRRMAIAATTEANTAAATTRAEAQLLTLETPVRRAYEAAQKRSGRKRGGGDANSLDAELTFNWADMAELFNALTAGYELYYNHPNIMQPLQLSFPPTRTEYVPPALTNANLAEAGISRSEYNVAKTRPAGWNTAYASTVSVGGRRRTRHRKHTVRSKRRHTTRRYRRRA